MESLDRRVQDVRQVVAAVPGIQLKQTIKIKLADLGMRDVAVEGGFGGEFEHDGPTVVKVLDDGKRWGNGETGIR